MHDINKLPILILAYNRYDKFQRCFDTLYRQGARNFYVSIDGPRSNKDIKIQREIYNYCKNRHKDVHSKVNNLRINYGCRSGPIKGISWFFKENKYGVILEDDVVISRNCLDIFCKLLQENINNKEIMSLSSFNEYSNKKIELIYSMPIWRSWGWATWANRWQSHMQYSHEISKYSLWQLYNLLPLEFRSIETVKLLKACQLNLLDAWDYEFNFSHVVKRNRSLTVGGINCLVYGFDESATHTFNLENVGVNFDLFNKKEIDIKKTINLNYKKSIKIMKKCGYFYSINNSKYKIFNDFLMCFFYTVIFNLRILKRNIIKRL